MTGSRAVLGTRLQHEAGRALRIDRHVRSNRRLHARRNGARSRRTNRLPSRLAQPTRKPSRASPIATLVSAPGEPLAETLDVGERPWRLATNSTIVSPIASTSSVMTALRAERRAAPSRPASRRATGRRRRCGPSAGPLPSRPRPVAQQADAGAAGRAPGRSQAGPRPVAQPADAGAAGRAPGRSQAGPRPLGGPADVPVGRGAVMHTVCASVGSTPCWRSDSVWRATASMKRGSLPRSPNTGVNALKHFDALAFRARRIRHPGGGFARRAPSAARAQARAGLRFRSAAPVSSMPRR